MISFSLQTYLEQLLWLCFIIDKAIIKWEARVILNKVTGEMDNYNVLVKKLKCASRIIQRDHYSLKLGMVC